MQVNDRRPCFGRTDCRIGNLLMRHGQIGGHRRGMDRPSDRAGDNDFTCFFNRHWDHSLHQGFSFSAQSCAIIGVRDFGQGQGAFTHGFTAQIGNTIFSDNRFNKCP